MARETSEAPPGIGCQRAAERDCVKSRLTQVSCVGAQPKIKRSFEAVQPTGGPVAGAVNGLQAEACGSDGVDQEDLGGWLTGKKQSREY